MINFYVQMPRIRSSALLDQAKCNGFQMTLPQYTYFSFNFKRTVRNSETISIDALMSDLVRDSLNLRLLHM